jgi:demethylmenaquinone methyltransferase/2-methoxy-6-polyprenyl-1,4-benzoquinol methylase
MKNTKTGLINKMFVQHFKADSWSGYNRAFFDGIAKKYDATNKFTSFGTKHILDRKAIAKFQLNPNAKILDLCAGTCDISIALAKKYPSAHITALDASKAMLEVGAKKLQKRGIQNVTTIVGDAMSTSFLDNSFDLVIISFGLRNLEDVKDGLKEMLRIVKPKGLVVNIEYGKPANALLRFIYWLYFENIAPVIGKILFHIGEFNSFRYLPESNKSFPDQRQLSGIMRDVGFKDVKNYNYFLGAVAQQVCSK